MSEPVFSISELPQTPAVYAMYGGRGRGSYVEYVGIARSLRGRVEQHLVRRDSSVTTGTTAVCLLPDHITEVRWWHRPDFEKQDVLEAAELVAFDLLEPALRSRGNITDRAKTLYHEPTFSQTCRDLFHRLPSGILVLRSLTDALDRIALLEKRMLELERRLAATTSESDSSETPAAETAEP